MLTQVEYSIAWTIYCCAAMGGLVVWWKLTRFIAWSPIRVLLRAFLAVCLLTPSLITNDIQRFAPAIFVLFFDMTLGDVERTKAVVPLILGGLLGSATVIIQVLFSFWKKPSNRQPPEAVVDDPKAAEFSAPHQ